VENRPIELVLLTGFLGSGKTTLLNSLLDTLGGAETAVLVNDFGPVAVDGGRLQGQHFSESIELYEVKDGSIFCSCRSADFVLGLRMFARRRPRRLIVEASGLADPRSMRKIIDDNQLTGEYSIFLTICMVDAVGSYKLRAALPAIEEQIRTADVLIVNKVDLAGGGELAATAAMLDELNPEAVRFLTSYARVDPSLLSIRGRTAGTKAPVGECALPGEGPQALLLENLKVTRHRLSRFLKERRTELLRLKGWYAFTGKKGLSWWYVSDNAGSIEWRREPLPAGQAPGLVAICREGGERELARAWRELTGTGERQ
jgi:G3E family GTPase